MLIQGEQADISRKLQLISRAQFLIQHRPRLKIRHVTVDLQRRIILSQGDILRGSLVVVNAGGTKATVIQSRYAILITHDPLPPDAPYETDAAPSLLSANQELDVGESCAVGISGTVPVNGSVGRADGLRLYVMGQIRYRDEGGTERFMGFCRELQGDARFHVVDDADYEYED
jgi:hypothetical protein